MSNMPVVVFVGSVMLAATVALTDSDRAQVRVDLVDSAVGYVMPDLGGVDAMPKVDMPDPLEVLGELTNAGTSLVRIPAFTAEDVAAGVDTIALALTSPRALLMPRLPDPTEVEAKVLLAARKAAQAKAKAYAKVDAASVGKNLHASVEIEDQNLGVLDARKAQQALFGDGSAVALP